MDVSGVSTEAVTCKKLAGSVVGPHNIGASPSLSRATTKLGTTWKPWKIHSSILDLEALHLHFPFNHQKTSDLGPRRTNNEPSTHRHQTCLVLRQSCTRRATYNHSPQRLCCDNSPLVPRLPRDSTRINDVNHTNLNTQNHHVSARERQQKHFQRGSYALSFRPSHISQVTMARPKRGVRFPGKTANGIANGERRASFSENSEGGSPVKLRTQGSLTTVDEVRLLLVDLESCPGNRMR